MHSPLHTAVVRPILIITSTLQRRLNKYDLARRVNYHKSVKKENLLCDLLLGEGQNVRLGIPRIKEHMMIVNINMMIYMYNNNLYQL